MNLPSEGNETEELNMSPVFITNLWTLHHHHQFCIPLIKPHVILCYLDGDETTAAESTQIELVINPKIKAKKAEIQLHLVYFSLSVCVFWWRMTTTP